MICDTGFLSLPKGIRLWKDTGFHGYKQDGVDVYMPKKKPKGKELTPEEKQENKRISGIRIKVEHAIGDRWNEKMPYCQRTIQMS